MMKTMDESTSDNVVTRALKLVDWTSVTVVEADAFGTTLSMMRDAETRLLMYGRLFSHRCAMTVGIVTWGALAVVSAFPVLVAVGVPSVAMLVDMLWCHSRNAIVHSILSRYREDVLQELDQLQRKYPAVT